MTTKYNVYLTLDELLLLDGKSSEAVQQTIDKAKGQHSFGFALPDMGRILLEAVSKGKLTWRHKQIKSCPLCDKKAKYALRKRTSSKGRAGTPDYTKPLYYNGLSFNEGFITIQGLGDMCSDCAKEHAVVETLAQYVIDNDVKVELPPNSPIPTRYKKDDIRQCFDCGEEMQESSMIPGQAIMGGSYPAGCPKCGAKAVLFGKQHKHTGKFAMVPQP